MLLLIETNRMEKVMRLTNRCEATLLHVMTVSENNQKLNPLTVSVPRRIHVKLRLAAAALPPATITSQDLLPRTSLQSLFKPANRWKRERVRAVSASVHRVQVSLSCHMRLLRQWQRPDMRLWRHMGGRNLRACLKS